MENLLAILEKIQQVNPLPFFSEDVIVVQNAGMQHWLNMSLAKQRGIAMNIRYALPAQFLWKLARSIASGDKVPDQSPYSREVLSWRILHILLAESTQNDVDFSLVNQYWQDKSTTNSSSEIDQTEQLKCYQLACKVADLFEQYLIYRPEWIDAWSNGTLSINSTTLHGTNDQQKYSDDFLINSKWQAKLWYKLQQEIPYNPAELMTLAIGNLASYQSLLPKRICFFGLNAMAPMWLNFIQALSKHTQVHFFHLNPCFNYWGDLLTEKQAIKQLGKWTENVEDLSIAVGNPLLANLGQQGREFIAQMQDYSTINIEVFEKIIPEALKNNPTSQAESLLQQVQHDILSLTDARTDPKTLVDNSIIITSCHSALREVQALHDWLLHQFNNDPLLTPKDVLVMCPQIEDYAPYVSAVFTRGWQDLDESIPPLPCSIADRSSQDTDPIVLAFVDLLNLPDSRFQVNHIVALLRLPSIQQKANFSHEELTKITAWLELTAVHWGIDQEHKKRILNDEHASTMYTWQQGLSRLIQGFAYGDQETIYQDQLLVPHVEGNDGVLLGKLMLFLEQLQHFSFEITKKRNAQQWQTYLAEQVNTLFLLEDQQSFSAIFNAIEALGEFTSDANYNDCLVLSVVKDFLTQHFSQPDPGRQFMVGQVTFCSMLPMRSIPFKVIAVLGLNDGHFPRQRQPLAFDLMAMSPAKQGDRSRRGDDRYLFLEALISARNALYLSYQGKNIHTNAEKQPSIVLKELIDYLQQGYQWDPVQQIRQMAMQPFSLKNYVENENNRYKSFDPNWLSLANSIDKPSEALFIENKPSADDVIELEATQLIQFFHHPAKAFARTQLNINLENYDTKLEDVEPFSFDFLSSYQLREQLLDALLIENEQDGKQHIEQILTKARLSGHFSDSPLTQPALEKWCKDSEVFVQTIKQYMPEPVTYHRVNVQITVDEYHYHIQGSLPISGKNILCYRSSSVKPKDLFTLYLFQLLAQCSDCGSTSGAHLAFSLNDASAIGYYFDTKSQKITQSSFPLFESPEKLLADLLRAFQQGQQQALLINVDLADKFFGKKDFDQSAFDTFWQGSANQFLDIPAFGQDNYIQYFWSNPPSIITVEPQIKALYSNLFTQVNKVNVA